MKDSALAELLACLCQTDTENPLPLWQHGLIGPCFNQLVLGALPHAGMAVVSAYYLGIARCSVPQACPPCGWTLRMVSALLLALLSAADVLLASVLQRGRMYLDVLTDGCGVLAWLLHLAALQVLLNTAHRRTRGPPVLFFMVLLLVPNLVLTLMLYCDDEDFLSLTKPFNLARFVLASTRALFFLLYLLAFAFPCVRDAGYSLHVDAEDGSAVEPGGSRPSTGEMVAEDGSGCISRLFYLWLSPLLARGRRGELNRPADVYHLPWKLRTRVVCGRFHQCWEACRGVGIRDRVDQWPKPIARNFRKDDQSSQFQGVLELEGDVGLLRVLHKAFGLRFYLLGVLKVAVNVSTFAGPLLLSTLVNFVEEKGAPLQTGVLCVLGLFLSGLLGSFLQNIFVFEVCKVALSARAALVSAVYGKALRVSSCSLAGFSLGEVVNLMSTDTDRVVNFFNSFHELWSLPFRFAVTLYLLYLQVGVAFLGGLCVVLVLVPLNKFLASRILRSNERMLECKDNRVKLMTEVLFGIRVIKFYNWEAHFSQKVAACRREELSHLRTLKYLDAVCVYTWAALPVVISITIFLIYVLLGHQLTAAKVPAAALLVGTLAGGVLRRVFSRNRFLCVRKKPSAPERLFRLTGPRITDNIEVILVSRILGDLFPTCESQK